MDAENERLQILERIERGEISVEEGVSLIETLPENDETAYPINGGQKSLPETGVITEREPNEAPEDLETPAILTSPGEAAGPSPTSEFGTPPVSLPPEAKKWKGYWIIPMWIGIGITALGGWLMYMAIESSGFGFWFICSVLLFTLGVIVISLSWQSQFSPWLHLRVQQRPGENPQRIAFSFPLPVRPAAWFFRSFGHHIQGLDSITVDEVLNSIDQVTNAENPIYIQVDEGAGGEKVEIYIG